MREVIADLQPNARAIGELEQLFGEEHRLKNAGTVPQGWWDEHTLCEASIYAEAELADVSLKDTQAYLTRECASVLGEFGHRTVTATLVTSTERRLTQTFSRTLFDSNWAGIAYPSRHDQKPCFALFQSRAWLEHPRELDRRDAHAVLTEICAQMGMAPPSTP